MPASDVDQNRTLCFGGSFNPIHHGHLITARAVAEAAGYSKVLLIPSSLPPHKVNNADIAPAEHRLALCKLAVSGDPLFAVSDIELSRTGPSYTIDTVRQLKADGWMRVHWLIGADMLQILPKWRQPQDLLAEAYFVIMARPGWEMDWKMLPAPFQRLQQNVVEAPLLQISASDIRQRVRAGRPIDYLVPAAVARYIREQRLYIGTNS